MLTTANLKIEWKIQDELVYKIYIHIYMWFIWYLCKNHVICILLQESSCLHYTELHWHGMVLVSHLPSRVLGIVAVEQRRHPDSKVLGAHLGPVVTRWALCWPHESCHQGSRNMPYTAADNLSLQLTFLRNLARCGFTYDIFDSISLNDEICMFAEYSSFFIFVKIVWMNDKY